MNFYMYKFDLTKWMRGTILCSDYIPIDAQKTIFFNKVVL